MIKQIEPAHEDMQLIGLTSHTSTISPSNYQVKPNESSTSSQHILLIKNRRNTGECHIHALVGHKQLITQKIKRAIMVSAHILTFEPNNSARSYSLYICMLHVASGYYQLSIQ